MLMVLTLLKLLQIPLVECAKVFEYGLISWQLPAHFTVTYDSMILECLNAFAHETKEPLHSCPSCPRYVSNGP